MSDQYMLITQSYVSSQSSASVLGQVGHTPSHTHSHTHSLLQELRQ